jgi:hypothetical protein
MSLSKKIYLAGKISKNGWRGALIELRGLTWSDAPVLMGHHFYVGPFFVSCDHGCYHIPTGHGSGKITAKVCNDDFPPLTRAQVHHHCLSAINTCDVVVAYINEPECYGTVVEIQYALDKNKRVIVCFAEGIATPEVNEYWLCCQKADRVHFNVSEQALKIIVDDLFWELL